jgi:hypothetical protein
VRTDAHLGVYEALVATLVLSAQIGRRDRHETATTCAGLLVWEMSGRCLAISRVPLYDTRTGSCSEFDGTLRWRPWVGFKRLRFEVVECLNDAVGCPCVSTGGTTLCEESAPADRGSVPHPRTTVALPDPCDVARRTEFRRQYGCAMAGSLPATEICLGMRWRKTTDRLALSAPTDLRYGLPPRCPAKAAS